MPTDAEELAALREAHNEVITKAHERKARIAELEAQVAALNNEKAAAAEMLLNVTIKQPLAKRAAQISPVPSLFLEQLEKHYTVKPDDTGALLLHDKDGKLILSNDKPVDVMEGNALWHVLSGGQQGATTDLQRTFQAIMRYAGAGHMHVKVPARAPKPVTPKPHFGLR